MLITDHIISIRLTTLLLMLGEMIGAGQNQTLYAFTSVEPGYHIQTTNVLA